MAVTTGNTSAPADDFGWDNVGVRAASTAIYLGDRWVLTAAHVGSGSVTFSSGTYYEKPGTVVQLENPDTFSGLSLSDHTDMVMFQLTAFPDLPSLTLSQNRLLAGSEVVLVGNGLDRDDELMTWDADWQPTDPPGVYRGFSLLTTRSIRWGINKIEGNQFGTRVLVGTENGDVISYYTDFDEQAGATAYESQAVVFDSGGGVFYKNGEQWELAGMIFGEGGFPNQTVWRVAFNNLTYVADISSYHDQIVEIMSSVEPAQIDQRRIFYAGSVFEQGNPALAVAGDKQALLPGQTATFENYTSFTSGVNGILIDVENLAAPASVSLDDFEFRVGNDDDPDNWTSLSSGATLAVTYLADDLYRVTLRFTGGLIKNEWLQVRMLANQNTGLAEDDVFYFGNAVGEVGDRLNYTQVTAGDLIGIQQHPHGTDNPAGITDRYDMNRDGLVNAADLAVARNAVTSPFDTLVLLQAPLEPTTSALAAPVPEPTSLVLILLGGLWLAGWGWRRTRR